MFFKDSRGALWVCLLNKGAVDRKSLGTTCLDFIHKSTPQVSVLSPVAL
jgi:hypothetical protein